MKKASTTTIIGFTTVILCFIILILTLTGLVHSSETMQTQIVQLTSSILILVLGFYFGASHKQQDSNQNNIKKMPQVFWDIQSLTDDVVEINGSSITPTKAQDLKNLDSNFEVLPDDTNVHVLMYNGGSSVTLKLQNSSLEQYLSISVVAEMFGGRPVRKPK